MFFLHFVETKEPGNIALSGKQYYISFDLEQSNWTVDYYKIMPTSSRETSTQ